MNRQKALLLNLSAIFLKTMPCTSAQRDSLLFALSFPLLSGTVIGVPNSYMKPIYEISAHTVPVIAHRQLCPKFMVTCEYLHFTDLQSRFDFDGKKSTVQIKGSMQRKEECSLCERGHDVCRGILSEG